ncbi:MAG: efflux RND transporter periplasmic adaptor subunit [Myxococcaceae bacterium]|nr:MAG: efflux RND transporter periplasmic adaptor subunit [Myxococcaceae bacterium]
MSVLLVAPHSLAHGGEDHGPPAARPAPTSDSLTMPIETQFMIGLRTVRIRRGVVAESTGISGHVRARPDGDARVAAPVAGRLVPPPGGFPILGARVRRGQLLGRLEQTLGASEAASVAAANQQVIFARNGAQQRLQAAAARLLLARQNAVRLQGLQGVVAARDIAAAQTEAQVAQTEVEQARRDVNAAGPGAALVVELRAPLDGTIVVASASAGSQIAQGTEVFRVADLSRLWIDLQLSESQAASLGPASTAVITSQLDSTLRLDGRRVAVGALVDEQTRTVQAIFEVDNAGERLRIGSMVDVAVQGAAAVEVLAVPQAAILEREGVPVVVVKTGPETFAVRGVRVGPRNASMVGVLSGLEPGERVVVEGASSVLLAAQ